jgi:ADP-ribose pyrophosphatase YjhB (NUDIX family)
VKRNAAIIFLGPPEKNPMTSSNYTYCPLCSLPLAEVFVHDKRRSVCRSCGFVHYKNPTVGVAVIVLDDRKILLGRRNGSYAGKWCIPCGHVEWDEDIRHAGVREFFEETGLKVTLELVFDAHSNFHDPLRQTVGVWFMGKIAGGKIAAGSDLAEVQWFDLAALPKEMAFPTDIKVCQKLLEQHKRPAVRC